ncbi:hypothetical protein [Bradyrhizobium sp.]|uniref:hypothetical protein n=1 Tax=Bradyrhizobium sp. TaxID=376 RepID=UPI0025C18D57|nr:hypothetical protein [Bradyrhizobium sp.]MBV8916660.1 hypothetical protein [Bradyrhizobium sp.]
MVGFPLLLIPIALYNAIAFLMPTVSVTDRLFSVTLLSGAEWPVTLSDVLLTLGVLLLLLEVIKGARPGAKYLTDHLLSLIVFGAAAFEFLMWRKFGTATFFLLTLIAMTEFLSGIALRTHRRAMPATATGPAAAEEPAEIAEHDDGAAEPAPDHAPAPAATSAVPAAASIAESVLMDHPEPKIAQPVVPPRESRKEPISEILRESKGEASAETRVEPNAEPKVSRASCSPAIADNSDRSRASSDGL